VGRYNLAAAQVERDRADRLGPDIDTHDQWRRRCDHFGFNVMAGPVGQSVDNTELSLLKTWSHPETLSWRVPPG
jgi:hypothetical protein